MNYEDKLIETNQLQANKWAADKLTIKGKTDIGNNSKVVSCCLYTQEHRMTECKKVQESNQTLKYREKIPEASSQLATSKVNQAIFLQLIAVSYGTDLVSTFAILDSESDSTLISKGLADKLQFWGNRSQKKLPSQSPVLSEWK